MTTRFQLPPTQERRESLIIEGVHLTTENTIELMRRHPSCIPFLVFISNAVKHQERFAVRAKYMALDTKTNRYIKHFGQVARGGGGGAAEARGGGGACLNTAAAPP